MNVKADCCCVVNGNHCDCGGVYQVTLDQLERTVEIGLRQICIGLGHLDIGRGALDLLRLYGLVDAREHLSLADPVAGFHRNGQANPKGSRFHVAFDP